MLIFFFEPWKSDPNDITEEIYPVNDSNLFMPSSDKFSCMYSTDKIKSVHILAKPVKAESDKDRMATVIV